MSEFFKLNFLKIFLGWPNIVDGSLHSDGFSTLLLREMATDKKYFF